MQKITIDPDISAAIDGVLIPAKSLVKRNKRQSLRVQAQQNALKIIKQAESDAKSVRESAYSAGYQAGIFMSIKAVADYIDSSQKTYQQFLQKTHEAMQENLRDVLGNESMFPALFTRWSEKISYDSEGGNLPLLLLIPKTTVRHRDKFLSQIQESWHGPIHIEQHDKNRFVIKYKSYLAEFSPEIWVSQQKLNTEECQQLQKNTALISRNALEQLLNELAQRLIN